MHNTVLVIVYLSCALSLGDWSFEDLDASVFESEGHRHGHETGISYTQFLAATFDKSDPTACLLGRKNDSLQIEAKRNTYLGT